MGAPSADGRSPFVGRAEELQQIVAAVRSALTSAGPAVALVGPAGIGKTALMEAVIRELGPGVPVLWTRGLADSGAPPFHPWHQLVRTARRRGVELEFPPPTQRALGVVEASAEPVDPDREAFLAADGMVAALHDAADAEGLVVVLDDVHWFDAASRDVADHLARLARGARVAVVAAWRPTSDVDPIGTPGDVLRVELAGLARPAIAVLARERYGIELEPQQLEMAYESSRGNPFHATQVVQLIDTGPTRSADPSAGLSPASRAVVQALAVLGDGSLELLEAVTGRLDESISGAVDEAVDAGLVRWTDDGIAFGHDLLRDGVLAGLGSEARGQLHARALAALQARYGDHAAWSSMLAFHARQAAIAGAGDDESARDLALAAGQVALQRLAFVDAFSQFERAVAAARRIPAERGRLVDALIAAGAAARHADTARSRELLREAAEVATDLGDPEQLAAAALAMSPPSDAVITRSRPDEVQIASLRRSLDALPSPSQTRCLALATLGTGLYWQPGGVEPSRTATLDALAEARALGDPLTIGRCLTARLAALLGPDLDLEVATLTAELAELADDLGDLELQLDSASWRVQLQLHEWDLPGLRRTVDDVAELARRSGSRRFRWAEQKWRGLIAQMEGRLDAAEKHADAARDEGDADEPTFYGVWAGSIGAIRWMQGRSGERLDTLRRLVEDHDLPASWAANLAAALAEDGDDLAARPILDRLSRGWEDLPRDMTWISTLMAASRAAVAMGDVVTARALAARLHPYADRIAVVGHGQATLGPVALTVGQLYLCLDDRPEAGAMFALAARRASSGPFEALARLHLVALGGDDDAASLEASLAQWGVAVGARASDRSHARLGTEVPAYLLTRHRDGWTVAHPTGQATLRSVKGLEFLAVLLERPAVDVHVLDLAAVIDGHAPVRPPSLDHMLDDEAVTSFRDRLRELEPEIEQADRRNDTERAAAARAEFDAIVAHLSERMGLHGPRPIADDAERARSRVTKAVKLAIQRLGAVDEHLGRHLAACVSTGYQCRYDPASGPSAVVEVGPRA